MVSVPAGPPVQVIDDSSQHGGSWEILGEDHRVPGLPNVPENDKHDVKSDLWGEIELVPDVPRLLLLTVRDRSVEAAPNPLRSRAGSEDVIPGFQHAATGRAIRLIDGLDLLAIKVCPRVHPVKVNEPAKEFDFPRKVTAPNKLGPLQLGIIGMKKPVSALAGEGGHARTEQTSPIRVVQKLGVGKGVLEDGELI